MKKSHDVPRCSLDFAAMKRMVIAGDNHGDNRMIFVVGI